MPVVLITGGARGLGKIFSEHFLKNGFAVAVNYHTSETAAKKIKEKAPEKILLLPGDIKNSETVKKIVAATIKKFKRIDVLINNAAIIRDRLLIQMTEDDWNEVIQTNLTASFYFIREVAKYMRKQKSGHIINISSIVALRGNSGEANYASAKAGLISLTRTAARELGKFNICVNAVLPGFHLTDMGRAAPANYYQQVLTESVLGRTTSATELAEFLVFLSKQRSVSGQIFNWDSRII